jgi:ribonuclease H2 subunit B
MQSRKKSASVRQEEVRGKTQPSIVLIAQENVFETYGNVQQKPAFTALRHPRTDQKALYMFSDEGRRVHEIVTFNEVHRSWFIGDCVKQDGTFHIATPVDPVFLLLPYLTRASAQNDVLFRQLECIAEDEKFPETSRLTACSLDDLHLVTEVKGADDYQVYRYDEDKTLAWLRLKVDKVAETLKESLVNVTSAAMVTTFVRSTKYADSVQGDYTRYACDLVSEYLQPELAKRLQSHLGIDASTEFETVAKGEPLKKKSRLDSVLTPTEDYSQLVGVPDNKKSEKKTSAQRKLSKVDTQGMKSMSSFFSAKPVTKK